MNDKCPCGGIQVVTEYTLVCRTCGIEQFGMMLPVWNQWSPNETVNQVTYTRRKRFKKYLQRASKHQSNNSIPRETWEYLFKNAPYSDVGGIIHALKRGKLRKKCYDSLPLIATALLDTPVPNLTEQEKNRALSIFELVDNDYSHDEPFCSYLYILEYILIHIGRSDVVAFLNKIQCPKRRDKYKRRLDSIIANALHISDAPASGVIYPETQSVCYNSFASISGRTAVRE